MTYMIFDSGGNALGYYDDLNTAQAAVFEIVESEPSAVDEISLLEYSASGAPLGVAIPGRDIVTRFAVDRYLLARSTGTQAQGGAAGDYALAGYFATGATSPRVVAAPAAG